MLPETALLGQMQRSQRFRVRSPPELAPDGPVAAEGDSPHQAPQKHDSGEYEHVQDEIDLLFHVVDGNLLIQRDIGVVADPRQDPFRLVGVGRRDRHRSRPS